MARKATFKTSGGAKRTLTGGVGKASKPKMKPKVKIMSGPGAALGSGKSSKAPGR